MRRILSLMCCGCVLLAGVASGAELSDKAKAELKRLAGNWHVVEVERTGQPEDPSQYPKITIVGDKILLNDQDEGLRIVAIDPDSSPRPFDVKMPDGAAPMESIYELDGDTLKLCTNSQLDGLPQRPTDFSTRDNTNFVVTVLKRLSP